MRRMKLLRDVWGGSGTSDGGFRSRYEGEADAVRMAFTVRWRFESRKESARSRPEDAEEEDGSSNRESVGGGWQAELRLNHGGCEAAPAEADAAEAVAEGAGARCVPYGEKKCVLRIDPDPDPAPRELGADKMLCSAVDDTCENAGCSLARFNDQLREDTTGALLGSASKGDDADSQLDGSSSMGTSNDDAGEAATDSAKAEQACGENSGD